MAKRNIRTMWVFALLLVVGAIFYWQNSAIKVNRENVVPKQLYTLDKTGAGTVVDYSAASQRIHAAVDSGFDAAGLSPQSSQESKREVPRQKVEGTIRWSVRQMIVTVSGDITSEKIQNALENALRSSGGVVLTSQTDSYQGMPVIRMDVGIRDTLGGDTLTLVTDKIYLSKKKLDAMPTAPTEGVGKMAFVIDDFGYSNEAIIAYSAISRPLTYSVLPYRPYSTEAANRALSVGHQVMLHLPMEALSAAEAA